jgi:T4 RnlA family RNA ligase
MKHSLTLNDFNHLRSNKMISFKEEIVNGITVVIIEYQISTTDMWSIPLALETRGITFEKETGKLISRPFEKFFNLGENDWTTINNFVTGKAGYLDVKVKRDGSMLTPVLVNDKIFWKTKKSFYSDVAIMASKHAETIYAFNDWCKLMCEYNLTPIFEFTSPDNRVVIDYGVEPKFTLLAIRDNETGLYQDLQSYSHTLLNDVYLIEKVDITTDIETFISSIKDMKGVEGYVITMQDRIHSNRVSFKVKTRWYSDNHRVMTDLRERDVAVAVLNESVDDMKALAAANGHDTHLLESVEKRVVDTLSDIMDVTNELAIRIKEAPSRKDAAMLYKDNKYFSLAIRVANGSVPDYKYFFEKNLLNLKQLLLNHHLENKVLLLQYLMVLGI